MVPVRGSQDTLCFSSFPFAKSPLACLAKVAVLAEPGSASHSEQSLGVKHASAGAQRLCARRREPRPAKRQPALFQRRLRERPWGRRHAHPPGPRCALLPAPPCSIVSITWILISALTVVHGGAPARVLICIHVQAMQTCREYLTSQESGAQPSLSLFRVPTDVLPWQMITCCDFGSDSKTLQAFELSSCRGLPCTCSGSILKSSSHLQVEPGS